ncbi:phytanoyl-CoA dioxygenase PhyH [Paenibacillus cellulosilyticus]|uniref:Phytanoyl-CoA dioxygenase PhyH n=1 Tax=Paenibacillus cellulosilyticus TaxID=375489 RepID=A0A2V2YUI7_9BACL|nr:phytanoyl-CoA dioxygenase family protein [Paenibacillus cellulosilyticus]PWW03248.1 phytanoyl-CoA dioxygenase PhyH [Paenibacillus cellulosilyticus]QKS43733.1 phytanoyl-CoA dioxygenase family protein [Paenibacillus cellulosilyticus]
MYMKLTEDERITETMEPGKLEFAVELLRANGVIIIENVFSESRLNEIAEPFYELLSTFAEGYDYGQQDKMKNLRMDLPFMPPFIDTDVVANPIFLSIAEQVLGDDLTLRYLASNNAMPGGTEKQSVHADTGALFPEARYFQSPTNNLLLHIPLCDLTELNGATEFYPGGTHLNPDHLYDNPKLIQRLGEAMHFEKALMPKGSLMIRDKKVWHRGCPNLTDNPRGMLTLIYQRAWDATSGRMPIPRQVYDDMPDRVRRLFRMESISAHHTSMDSVSGAHHYR